MNKPFDTSKLLSAGLLILFVSMLFITGGCARYAHQLNALYESSTDVRGGSGDIYIVIPDNLQTVDSNIKWVLGKVTDDENKKIDELYSPRSPAELAQSALTIELKHAGYTVYPVAERPKTHTKLVDMNKVEISLDQLSDFADLKASCRVLVTLDLYKKGQLIRKLQYEASSSKTDIKDRDLLARIVLQEALQSVMKNAVRDIVTQLEH